MGLGFGPYVGVPAHMKLTLRVKLTPDKSQHDSLVSTLERANAAAIEVSAVAWNRRIFRNYDLRAVTYGDVKALGFGAQVAQTIIRKVADSYKLDKRTKRSFAKHGAIAYDDRCLSWQIPEVGSRGTVSIWTVDGRLKNVPFVGSPEHVALIREHRKGESDLLMVDGELYLSATVDLPDVPVNLTANTRAEDWLGVDMGIVNIAVTSDGVKSSGSRLNRYRKRQQRLRAELQRKGTKAAKRRLKARRRREARHVTNTNHIIAKQIVAEAERTGRGIAVEDLTGIRNRGRLRKPQRTTLNSWAFHQLGQHLAYKAARAGVAFVQVDPAYTSQECAECGHTEKQNRPDQATFVCRDCGVIAESADHNAAKVIAKRGPAAWAAVSQPQPKTAKAA